MGHPSVENRTPYAFASVYLHDEEARPLLVILVRATYEWNTRGLVLAENPPPVPIAGETHSGGASPRYEAETAFFKPATDVVLIGRARPPHRGAVETEVHFRVGPVAKTAHIVGDRQWVRSAGAVAVTKPLPFDEIPLVYERAFGGCDTGASTPTRSALDPRNPIGRGFCSPRGNVQDGAPLPNIEDCGDRLRRPGQVVPVVGFGFTRADWQPRAGFAGTYDAAWAQERMPRLPRDLDRRFFNAAAAGLVAPGYLRGDEAVVVSNVSPAGTLGFQLPGPPRPGCLVSLRNRRDVAVEMRLDTVVVNTDEQRVHLTWRGAVQLRDGAHDVVEISVRSTGDAQPVRRNVNSVQSARS